MANTGYQISPIVKQYYNTGPNSGSVVTSSFDVNLTLPPFSASLNNDDYFYRSYNPIDCEPGFNNCITPLLTSITTGSSRGRFAINYVTQSSTNLPLDITASISNDPNFGTSEIFSASIGSTIPITSSFISGTVYFKAFTSCSGPNQSPDSLPLAFTYDQLPVSSEIGDVNIIFKNNLSSPMEVQIDSLRGNLKYTILPGNLITYDYSSFANKSDDLRINIKGGAKSTYGNIIQRTTLGIENETYTTGGGFNNPNNSTDNSNTFTPDEGLSFNIKQLSLPIGSTTTTFTLLINTSESDINLQFGSTPFSTSDSICSFTNKNPNEVTYYRRNGYLYNTREEALDDNKSIFSNLQNYILISQTEYLLVNQNGYIQDTKTCILPTVTIDTSLGFASTQESSCKRNKQSGETFEYRNNKIIGNNLSGRYPLYEGNGGRGGRNIILSNGNIVGYENCGSELSPVEYGITPWDINSFPLQTPENVNPITLNKICNDSLNYYLLGPSGTVYYNISSNPYIPLGNGTSWYKTTTGTFVNFDNGLIIDTTSPC